MLVHRRFTPNMKYTGTHLHIWVERGTVRVKCLAQDHNTMSLAKDIVLYSITRVGVFLLPNPSQGYPQHTIHWKAQLGGERHCEGKKATLISKVSHQYYTNQWSVPKGYTSH